MCSFIQTRTHFHDACFTTLLWQHHADSTGIGCRAPRSQTSSERAREGYQQWAQTHTHTHTPARRSDAMRQAVGCTHTCNSPSPPRPIFLTTRLACDRRMAGWPQPHPGPLLMPPKRYINGSHPLCPAASPHTCAHGTPKVTPPRVPTDVKHRFFWKAERKS
jgi:hypothetical protein